MRISTLASKAQPTTSKGEIKSKELHLGKVTAEKKREGDIARNR